MNGFLACAACLVMLVSGCGRTTAGTASGASGDVGIFVKKIDALNAGFIKGVDISSVLALEKSGVVFRDAAGNPQDVFKTLKDSGINSVRIRVWNNPFDENGNGFGGGNCDIATAIAIGKRAAAYKITVLLDFHYSDFWADPAKQQAPRAWKGMSVDDKATALYSYTKDCLAKVLAAGIDVRMVQIGNETTNSFCSENNWLQICKLFNAGSRAVREVSKSKHHKMQVAIHFTNPEKEGEYERFVQILQNQKVDYDVFATSWYPYWHGTAENLTSVLKNVVKISGKKVLCAEFSYAYTNEDGDGFPNSISAETMCAKPWPFTVQGQADAIREAIAAVNAVGKDALGLYYWEPAWLPVPGADSASRQVLWERDGSGWASSFASEYDSADAGKFFGGSSWDNQALFDFEGKPLASLAVWNAVKIGTVTTVHPDAVDETSVRTRLGDKVALPDTVTVLYNNGERKQESIVWNDDGYLSGSATKPEDATNSNKEPVAVKVSEMSRRGVAEYLVSGTAADGMKTKAKISIVEKNYIENASFEDADISMWKIENIGGKTTELFVQDKASDAKTGNKALHFWSKDAVSFTVSQTVTGLAPGTYKFSLAIQGGDAKNQKMSIFAVSGGKKYTIKTDVDGWRNFRNPKIMNISVGDGTVTVGASIECDAKGWGSLDDFALSPVD